MVRSPQSFFGQFLAHPGQVGAIAPSSARLAEAMVEWIDWAEVETVAEYGPGTGAFTAAIRGRLSGRGRLLAIEINPGFAAEIGRRFPDVAVHQRSAEEIRAICDEEGIGQIDAVVCGLPWAAFSSALQIRLLDAMMSVLRPGGQFVTFAYLQGLLLPAGQRFRRRLDRYFSHVQASRTVWRNLPPALVYRCRR